MFRAYGFIFPLFTFLTSTASISVHSPGEKGAVGDTATDCSLATDVIKETFDGYDLQANITVCSNVDNISTPRLQLWWTCVLQENDNDNVTSSLNDRMFLINCKKSDDSPPCFHVTRLNEISRDLCQADVLDSTCRIQHLVLNGTRNKFICIRHFRDPSDARRDLMKGNDESATLTSPLSIVAYVSAAFIVCSFLLAVLIPEEKCRIKYQYERDAGLRVPLEIYEMYGVHYQPSFRRQILEEVNTDHVVSTPANRKVATVVPVKDGEEVQSSQQAHVTFVVDV